MHLGNGAITPECGLIAAGVAAAGVGAAMVAARSLRLDRNQAWTAGALGAAVFAAQMFNVQILPYSSAHLIGGVLLAWALGPALGLLSMTVVLTLQALLLGDGGLLALGANVVNMGLVPVAAVMIAQRLIGRPMGAENDRRATFALGAAAFAATLAGAALITLEVAVGRGAAELDGWSGFAWRMLAAHACAGLLEAAATMTLVSLLNAAREPVAGRIALSAPKAALVGVASLTVALVSLPSLGIASAAPDAYQSALVAVGQLGHALGAIEAPAKLSGVAATAEAWQGAVAAALPMPEAGLAALGVLLTGLGAALCALGVPRRREPFAALSAGVS